MDSTVFWPLICTTLLGFAALGYMVFQLLEKVSRLQVLTSALGSLLVGYIDDRAKAMDTVKQFVETGSLTAVSLGKSDKTAN